VEDVHGAGQKSGQYWALDPDTGDVVWETQAGPGGTAGGLQWGSSVDGERAYTANANSNYVPWELPDGSVTKAIAKGSVYWGSGYSNFGGGTPNNKVYAFTV
jgi:polyvinyl alcohol dehydrogenase (cytochrome)